MPNFIAENIRFLRLKNTVSQDQLALQVKKGSTTISNWEKGVSAPSIEEIEVIANYFEVTPADFIFKELSEGKVNAKERVPKNEQNSKVIGKENGKVTPVLPQKTGQTPGEMTIKYVEDGVDQVADVGVRYNDGYSPVPKVVVVDITGKENAVLVPVKARAGYLTGYADPEFIGSLEAYKVPGSPNRSYRLFEVDGNSMFSTLHDKDTAKAYWVRLSDIVNDQVYVLITKRDGIIIKRIIKTSNGDLLCKSDNDDKSLYPNYIVPIKDVLEVWRVQTGETHNLAKPGDVYKRIVELEANIATIMSHVGLLKAPEN